MATLLATNHPSYLRRLIREINRVQDAHGTVYVRGATQAHRVHTVSYLVAGDALRVRLTDGGLMMVNGSDAAGRFTDGRDGGLIVASREVA